MRKIRAHMRFCMALIGLLLVCAEASAMVMEKAGTTIANAPFIADTMLLQVQSGANYIRVEPNHLPATVVYMPSAPFGTIPEMVIMGDTLPKQAFFGDCMMGWVWEIPESEATALVEVSSHETATILAAPMITTVETHIVETACDSFVYEGVSYMESGEYPVKQEQLPSGEIQVTILDLTINHTEYDEKSVSAYVSYTAPSGKVYTESGTYMDTVLMYNGCNRITTIHLTIKNDEPGTQTIYFCEGFNTEHQEQTGETIRWYRPYVFQSPAEWDYMEGVVLERAHEGTLLDLRRAETNLYDHYVGELTPISAIRWSVQYDGQGKYEPLTVTDEPQWVAAGHVAIQINFLCGEMYNTEFPTDIDHVSQETVSIKRIEKGRVVIIRGGIKYDIFGNEIH